jgi:orotate phosphoribosyltransferase/uridine monophosphate synthetase
MPRSRASNLWLAQTLWKLGAVQFGNFTLGRTTVDSPVYINLRLLVSNPTALWRAAHVMHDEVLALMAMRHPQIEPFDLVAGVPFGGLHLATAFSLTAKVPMIYLHPKDGTSVIEGVWQPGQRVLIIDDLITTGGSILETTRHLEGAGLLCRDVMVLVDRQQGARGRLRHYGYNLISILGLETILNHLMSTGKIDEEWYRRSVDYIHEHQAEMEE